jgi:hypothetical protein
MANALALGARIKCCATDSTMVAISGVDSIDIERGLAKANVEQMGDTAGRFMASQGVMKGSFTFTRDRADAGQIILFAACAPGGTGLVWLTFYEDGTNGWKAQCWIDLKTSPKQGPDALKYTCSYEVGGGTAPVAIP